MVNVAKICNLTRSEYLETHKTQVECTLCIGSLDPALSDFHLMHESRRAIFSEITKTASDGTLLFHSLSCWILSF